MSFQKRFYYLLQDFVPRIFMPYVLRVAVLFRFLAARNKQVLKKNLDLKNIAAGKDAFLLATGPSLKGIDLGFLAGNDCFSVSNFILHPQLNVIRPKFHFFAPYHEPLVYEEYISWLVKADKELPLETSIVLGLQTKVDVEKFGIFQSRSIYYLCLEKSQISSDIDLTRPVLAPQTSPIMVLPVLHYMGYKRVFLLGCDHNILKDYGGVVENFYEAGQDPRKNATSGDNWRDGIIKHLDNAKNVFVQYEYYRKIFESSGRSLKHTSKHGWLDFIEYVPLNKDDIFKAEK